MWSIRQLIRRRVSEFVLVAPVVLASPAGLLMAGEAFTDDFNREDGPVDATPEDDWLTYMGTAEIRSQEMVLESGQDEGWVWIDRLSFAGDITIQFDIQLDRTNPQGEGRHGGVMFFGSEETCRNCSGMKGYIMDWIDRTSDYGFRFRKFTNGSPSILIPDGSAPDPEIPRTWQISVSGPKITFAAGGEVKATVEDTDYREGWIGFWGWARQRIHIDNVSVGEPPPNAPRDLSAAAGGGKVDLSWDEPEAGPAFTGYRVLRNAIPVADLPSTQRTYSDTGLEDGTRYCYVVQATRGQLASLGSNEACATPEAGGKVFHRGDANDDGMINLTDGIFILNHLFLGGPTPPCLEAANSNDDGAINITDGIAILNFLFTGGASPAAPGPPGEPCGSDPPGEDLGCGAYTTC